MSPQGPSLTMSELAQPQAAPPAEGWASTAASLPKDIPDSAYDAVREKYFYEHMAPAVLQTGGSLSQAQSHFMANTERVKAENPRLDVMATEAGKALTAPISAMNPMWEAKRIQESIDTKASEAGKEAMKQGINPTPYAWAGQAAGMAPYFAEGMMGPEAASASLEQGLVRKAIRASSVGLIQGAYDGVTAPEGEGSSAALKGFILGAGMEGGLEGVGSMWSYLRGAHGMSVDAAKAVEAVAKGVETKTDVTKTNAAVLGGVDVEKSVEKFAAADLAGKARQGQPTDVSVDTPLPKQEAKPSQRVKIAMVGADGKTYNLGGAVGLKLDDLDKIYSRVNEHLNAGGSIKAINGDPAVIQQMMTSLAEQNPEAFSLDNPIRPKVADAPPAKAATVKATGPATESQSTWKPAPMVRDWLDKQATEGKFPSAYDIQQKFQMAPAVATKVSDWHYEQMDVRSSIHDTINSRDSVYHATTSDKALDILTDKQIGLNDKGNVNISRASHPWNDWTPGGGVKFVLDRNQVSSEPIVDTQGKTRQNYIWNAEQKMQPTDHAMNLDYETEERASKPIPTSAVRGIVISRDALKNEDISIDKQSGQFVYGDTEQKISGIKARAKELGIPVKFVEDDKAFKAYRAGISKLKASQRFAVDLKDIPQYDKLAQLPNGEIINRETGEVFDSIQEATKPPNLQSKETPFSRRFTGDSGFTPAGGETLGATVQIPGQEKPYIFYRDAKPDKATIFHENLHGHFGALDMHEDLMDIMDHPMTEDMYNRAFTPETKEVYAGSSIYREEVYVHGADAIRTNNTEKLNAFIDADTDRETYLGWMTKQTQALRDRVAEAPDSLHKRALERKLGAVESRATGSLADVANVFSQADAKLGFENGQYAVRNGDKATLFAEREDALQAMEPMEQPLNSPELVDISRLPEGTARYSRQVKPYKTGETPNKTDPPSPEVKQARGGLQLASRFFRPFNDWVATVAQKNSWPEVYDAFAPMDHAQVAYNNTVRPHFEMLRDGVAKASEARQADYYRWFAEPSSDHLNHEMQLKPEEIQMLEDVKDKVIAPLDREFGTSLQDYVQKTLPGLKVSGNDLSQLPKSGDFMVNRLKRGSLDPDETNFTKLVAKYLEFGSWDKHIKPVVDNAEKVIGEELPDTLPGPARWSNKRAGNLFPLLQRHIDYMRGQPDFTQQIIQGTMEGALDMINQGMEKVNAKLGTKFEPFTDLSKDPLEKYTLFAYAGALALKPATIVRDALQIMLTTFPIAGKYTFRGINKAFGTFKGGETADNLWSIPQKYGALIERNDLRSLYTGTDESSPIEGRMEKIANWGMRSIQFTHNSNRLAAFWGHSEQMLDALSDYRTHGDKAQFIRDSGLWFMSPSQRDSFLKEVPNLTATTKPDFSYRVAKELTELSQWNFKRGANPGLYEYQLGRLFGQYGTWPLNYIEYARRLATSGDGKAAQASLMRLTLAHGAVLAAGQGLGIDTGRWVFTGPMAYEGGPLFEAMTALPSAASPDEEGSEARRKLAGVVPGLERLIGAADIFKDVVGEKPDYWPNLLGFHVMHGADFNRGLHALLPREDN